MATIAESKGGSGKTARTAVEIRFRTRETFNLFRCVLRCCSTDEHRHTRNYPNVENARTLALNVNGDSVVNDNIYAIRTGIFMQISVLTNI